MAGQGVVEYFGKHENYSCGYCKSSDTSVSHGLWSHCLTPQEYQDMIDRGWRRSGKYCYKPTMNHTCCPQYTIRCEALNFKLSKSQKKVLKKVNHYLATGQKKHVDPKDDVDANEQPMDHQYHPGVEQREEVSQDIKKTIKEMLNKDVDAETEALSENIDVDLGTETSEIPSASTSSLLQTEPKIKGADPNLPQSRKAKDIRQEKRLQKLIHAGHSREEALQMSKTKKQKNCEKSLEDFVNEKTEKPAHNLELLLVPADVENPAFQGETYYVYQKYQRRVHRDPPEKCTLKQFSRFLVSNPFQTGNVTTKLRGAFHMQYWLDDRLIAVGVLDILPFCVSSVYFYYDPDYSFLSLGTYGSLREIAFTRELRKKYPSMLYYYMGFYIHTCPKMKYKGSYSPSFLLCPETYSFCPIEICLPKLAVSKYQRFEEDLEKGDEDGEVQLDEVKILYRNQAMDFLKYTQLSKQNRDKELIEEYANLIGRKCYRRILLYRS